jgi:hypothetical protein
MSKIRHFEAAAQFPTHRVLKRPSIFSSHARWPLPADWRAIGETRSGETGYPDRAPQQGNARLSASVTSWLNDKCKRSGCSRRYFMTTKRNCSMLFARRLALSVATLPMTKAMPRQVNIDSWRTRHCVPWWRKRRGHDQAEPWTPRPPAALNPCCRWPRIHGQGRARASSASGPKRKRPVMR